MEDPQSISEQGHALPTPRNTKKYPASFKLILFICSVLVAVVFGVLFYLIYTKYTEK